MSKKGIETPDFDILHTKNLAPLSSIVTFLMDELHFSYVNVTDIRKNIKMQRYWSIRIRKNQIIK